MVCATPNSSLARHIGIARANKGFELVEALMDP